MRSRRAQRGTEPLRLLCYSDATRVAGAEGVMSNVIAALDSSFAITVVGPEATVVAAIAAANPNASTRVVPRVATRRNLAAWWALRRQLKQLHPDVVHINLTDMAACLPATVAALSLRGVGVVVVEHHPWPPSSVVQRAAKMATVRLADAHIAVSHSLAAAVGAVARRDPARVQVIANGVPSAAAVDRPPLVDRPLHLGLACRLDHDKGVDVVLQAVASVAGVLVSVAGNGPDRPDLERLAVDLGIDDRVRFLGWVDEPSALYDAIDVFVLGSRAEALPLSILEAMHAGRPVVATNVGGVTEAVVHGVTGIVVPPDDPVALAGAIRELSLDGAAVTAMGQAGLRRARAEFDVDTMARRYREVYERVRPQAEQ